MGCLKLPYQTLEEQTLRVVYRKSETQKTKKASKVSKTRYRKHYATIFPAEIKINEDTDATVITQYLGGDAYTAPVIKQNSQYRYLHRDHLGSILAITDDLSRVLEKRHFGAWGMVEYFEKNGKEADFSETLLTRGFTGHEHFEEVDAIHMNGRMYNPRLHRFVSPDNFIQDPYNTMSYDRQAYVWNNPLMASDPSGEFIATVMAIVKIVSFIMTGINTLKALVSGASLGNILLGIGVGILLGQLSAGIAGGLGGALFSSAAETLAGHFIRGFVPAFVGGLISGTVGGLMNGANIGDALKSGVISGAIAGTLAGLKNVHGAKVAAQKLASAKADFDLQKRAEAAFGGGAEVPSVTAEGLAENVKAKWGADTDLRLGASTVNRIKPAGVSLQTQTPYAKRFGASFDRTKAILGLNGRVQCGPTKECGKFVRYSLEDGGINTRAALNNRELTDAYKYDKFLSEQGFRKIGHRLDSYTPRAGDIMVFDKTINHIHGHIQMFNGANWVSDFVQNTPYPWTDYGRYSIFRW